MSNATTHSRISVRHRKGCIEDYYALHDFMDCTKELESSNKHRIFHNLWGIKQIIIPIFGHTIKNSDGIDVNVKDMMESDHVLADYGGKYIPTLSDFVDAVSDDSDDIGLIERFHHENNVFFQDNLLIKNLLYSPLWITGKIKSLLLTHNSWFIGFILPKIFPKINIEIKDFNISPSIFFNRMDFREWMQNGRAFPPSFLKIKEKRDKKNNKTLPPVLQIQPNKITYDRSIPSPPFGGGVID